MTFIKAEQSAPDSVWQLHLRNAKGESLTNEEQAQLASWYVKQEQQERAILQPVLDTKPANPLQTQIDAILTQIAATTLQIQKLNNENEVLQQKILRLEARLKAVLIGSSLTIPITAGHLNLGTWQGIYLCEHRNRARGRRLVITLWGEGLT